VCSRASSGSTLPRWGRLYVIVGVGAAALELANIALASSPVRSAVLVAIVVSTGVVMTRWVAANRVELDLAQWCECARDSMTVRVIARPAPPRASHREAPSPALEATAGRPRA
jgi:hypothetical protein